MQILANKDNQKRQNTATKHKARSTRDAVQSMHLRPAQPMANMQQDDLPGPEYWRLVHVDSPEARYSPEEAAVARAAGWDYFTLVPGDALASVFPSFRQWDSDYCS